MIKDKILLKIQNRIDDLHGMTTEDIPDLDSRSRFYKDLRSLIGGGSDGLNEFRNAYDLSDNCRHGKAYFSFCERIIEDILEQEL